MVFLNGLKYACEACIKGHRSSSCSHTDRALFEIKKKGRPVTQCEHCRQLRKAKQVHVKCSCEGSVEEKEPRGKAKRKMPTSPAFPEGLKGVAASTSTSASSSPAPPQKRKDSPSNTCDCKTSGRCECSTPVTKKPARPRARAPSTSNSSGPATPPPGASCCGGAKIKTESQGKPRVQHDTAAHTLASLDEVPRAADTPTLQPLAYISASASHSGSSSMPVAQNQAGHSTDLYSSTTPFSWPSGVVGMCSCGVTCACPGCFEHSSDLSTAFTSSESCPYACTTCIDCNGFGFVASVAPAPGWAIGGGGGGGVDGLTTFDAWPASVPTALLPPAPASTFTTPLPPHASTAPPHMPPVPITSPASASPSASSDCCGGACKCTAQALACACAASCCGCCFGCSCSDTESAVEEREGEAEGEGEGEGRERLGFAVSGERGSCCEEGAKDKDRRDPVKDAVKRKGGSRGKDNDEDSGGRRKRRKVDSAGDPNSYPYPAIAETTFFRTPLSGSTRQMDSALTVEVHGPNSTRGHPSLTHDPGSTLGARGHLDATLDARDYPSSTRHLDSTFNAHDYRGSPLDGRGHRISTLAGPVHTDRDPPHSGSGTGTPEGWLSAPVPEFR